jgi:alpha-tubulin suppressor-like RCC1 family protein
VLVSTDDNSMVLDRDGSVWSWGTGRGDEKGTWPERQMLSSTPERLAGVAGVVSLSSSESHSLALLEDGTVLSWGSNVSGQLGNGTRTPRPTREPVVGLTDAVAIAAGSSFSLAVRGDGTVWSWGDNSFGTLGDGTRTRRLTPVQVQGLTDVVAVTTGINHSLALRADGAVWAWGNNLYGKLGDGTSTQRLTPVQVVGLTDVVAIESAGNSSFAVRRDGTVWAWGNNNLGQLGNPSAGWGSDTPVQVQGLAGVVSVFAGIDLAVAVRGDGTVWFWGCAQDSWDPEPQVRQVPGLTNITHVTVDEFGLAAVRADGTVWQWFARDLPAGTPPRQVEGFTDAVAVAYTDHTLQVVRSDGTVWNQGDNHVGERGFPSESLTPPGPTQVPGLTGVVSLASSAFGTTVHALRADGTAAGWGSNSFGMLGSGLSSVYLEPTQVPLPCRLKVQGSGDDALNRCAAAP